MDYFSLESHRKAREAKVRGSFANEIVPIDIGDKQYLEDELNEVSSSNKPVFRKDGVITKLHASSMADGAAVIILTKKSLAV